VRTIHSIPRFIIAGTVLGANHIGEVGSSGVGVRGRTLDNTRSSGRASVLQTASKHVPDLASVDLGHRRTSWLAHKFFAQLPALNPRNVPAQPRAQIDGCVVDILSSHGRVEI
jgi:hypothetical protein